MPRLRDAVGSTVLYVANFARVLRLVYGVIFYAARTSTGTALFK